MLLTDLVELVANKLNEADAAWKPTNFSVKAQPCLDWVSAAGQTGFKVLIVPELIQYNVDGQRRVVRTTEQGHFISLLVGFTFESTVIGSQDVAPWEDVKEVIDTRQRIEEAIIEHDYSSQKIALAEVEGQPVEELALQLKNFNAVTSFGFEALKCGSSEEQGSTPMQSLQSTESPEIRASIRRAALSERRLGRR